MFNITALHWIRGTSLMKLLRLYENTKDVLGYTLEIAAICFLTICLNSFSKRETQRQMNKICSPFYVFLISCPPLPPQFFASFFNIQITSMS